MTTARDAYLDSLNVDAQAYLNALDQEGIFVPFPVLHLTNGNPHDALVFGQILYWSKLTKTNQQPRLRYKHQGHYWIVKTFDEWAKELHMPDKERTLRRSFDRLTKLGLIIKTRAKSTVHKYTDSQGQAAYKSVTFVRLNWPVYLNLLRKRQRPLILEGRKVVRIRPLWTNATERTKWPIGIRPKRTKWPIAPHPNGQNGRFYYSETTLSESTDSSESLSSLRDETAVNIFDLYTSEGEATNPPAVEEKDSLTEGDAVESFRGEGDGTNSGVDVDSLCERGEGGEAPGPAGGVPDIHGQSGPAGNNHRSEPDPAKLPESGIIDDAKWRKAIVSRWPGFRRMQDDRRKWAQVSRIIKLLFDLEKNDKLEIPLTEAFTITELYAFTLYMREQQREPFQKITAHETIAGYVESFRTSNRHDQYLKRGAMILEAMQRSVPVTEPPLPDGPATVLTDIIGVNFIDQFRYDPNKQYIVPAIGVNHERQSGPF